MLRSCIILPFLIFLGTITTLAQKPAPVAGEPVIINNDTLFKFYANQGLFNPKERAEVVSKRINDVATRLDFNKDSLVLKNDSNISVISYKSQMLMAVNDQDASFSELNRPQLAASYLALLKQKLNNDFTAGSIENLAINIAEALTVVALLILLIWGVNRIFRVIRRRVLAAWGSRMTRLAEKGGLVGYAERVLPLINGLIRVTRLLIVILLVYLAFPILFLIFPRTKPIATELLSYVINPLESILMAFVHYIPNLLTIAVIYAFTHYIVKLIKFIGNEIGNGNFTIKGFYPEWAMPTYNIVRVLLYAFMFIVIFPYLPGSESKVFQGVTVFVGILFSFGSSSAISNMVAGIVLTYMRAYKIGDRIKAGEVIGDVFEKNLLVTRIRTIKNEEITVPNSTILTMHTVNYSSSTKNLGLVLHTSITIGYDAPWKTIHQLMISAALATEGILTDPSPFILQTDLNDFNVTYQINAYTKLSHKMAAIYSLLHQNILDKFNEAGVEIMSPHYTALRDGNAIQIPDDYKPKGYKKSGI